MREFKSVIEDEINKNKTLKLKQFKEKLIDTKYEISGVKTEVIKKLAIKISKEDYKDIIKYLEKPSFSNFEELSLYGMVLGLCKICSKEKQHYLYDYLSYVDNWETCDLVCSSFKDISKEKLEYFNFFLNIIKEEEEYKRRFAIVSFLNYYLDDEYIDKVLNIVKNIKDDRYYVKMAISWFMATALAKQWNKSVKVIESKELDPWIHNKSITKARESFRITKEQKEYLVKLRIK